ncbi:hypothetical protein OROGR_028612 [Orobanche gracilis]
MDNLGLVSSPKIVFGVSPNLRNSPIPVSSKQIGGLPNLLRRTTKSGRRSNHTPSLSVVSSFGARKATNTIVAEKGTEGCFASIASSGQQTSSVGASPQIPVPPASSSQLGSPLFWIGVGVGFSALFSWVAGRVKKYAMEQAFKTFTQQMNTQNNPFANTQNNPFGNTQNNPFAPGSPFPFPPPPQTSPTSDSFKSGAASQSVTDVPVTKVEDPPSTSVKDKVEPDDAPKKYAFVDVSPEETVRKNAFKKDYKESSVQRDSPNNYSQSSQHVSQNGTASTQGAGASQGPSSGKGAPLMSVDALEKMMEDPTVQQMVFPYLPEEMRNPTTFKWMLQNPVYRQQLQDMLNNMGGNPEWDNRMMDTLRNFDLSSPEIKQQFDQIGLTPQEVISKVMENPDVAMAFQNPRVQAAILDCSQNPLSIAKYQNDKEVMDVFNKITELFRGPSS